MAYNPGVQFDPSIITRGWENAASAIGGAIKDYTQLKKEDKAAKAFYDAINPPESDPEAPQLPHPLMPKDKWDALSSSDRISQMAGFIKATTFKSALEEQALARKRAAVEEMLNRQRLAAGDRETQANERYTAAARQGAVEPGATVPVLPGMMQFAGPINIPARRRNLSPAEKLEAATQAGMEPKGVADLARAQQYIAAAAQNGGSEADGTPQIDMLDLPFGNKGAVLRGSRDLKVFSNPASIQDGSIPQYDEAGNVIGYSIPDGKGRYTFRQGNKPEVKPGLVPAADPNTGTPMPGFYFDNTGRLHDLRNNMQKVGIGDLKPEEPKPGLIKRIFGGGKTKDADASALPNEMTSAPSDYDITYLKANPKMKAAFENRFGKGSAAKYLK